MLLLLKSPLLCCATNHDAHSSYGSHCVNWAYSSNTVISTVFCAHWWSNLCFGFPLKCTVCLTCTVLGQHSLFRSIVWEHKSSALSSTCVPLFNSWLKVKSLWRVMLLTPTSYGKAKSLTLNLSQFTLSGVNKILLSFTHLDGLGF